MKISYSFHLGSKGNTIASKASLKKVYNHNSRNYKDSNKIKRDEIIQIVGSKNIYTDVTKLYSDEFTGAIEKFNSVKGRKTRDKIDDYFEKISEDKQKSVAEEIIIGFGKKEFWEEVSFDKKEMTSVFEKQIDEFQKLYPNFKIANATLHYDEASPHMHIVGVPIKYGAKRGLENQVSKSSVFDRESLKLGQEKLRERFINDIKKINIKDKTGKNIGNDLELGEKEKGRNFNYSLEDYKNLKDEEKKLKQQEAEQKKLDKELAEREVELDEREANIPNEVKNQVAVLEEELLDEQLNFYHKMILDQTEQIKEINELLEEPLKITDEVLESVNNSYFDNVYDYFSVGDDLLKFNNEMFVNIEYAEMTFEETAASIADYFEDGFKVVQSVITNVFNNIMNLASVKSKELDERETNIDNTVDQQVKDELAKKKKKLEDDKAAELKSEKEKLNQQYKLQLSIDSLINHINYLNKFVNIINTHDNYPLTFEYAYELHENLDEREEVNESLVQAINVLTDENEEKTFERVERIKNIILKIGKFVSNEFSGRFGIDIDNDYDEPTR